jgi:hypothetical protein
VFLSLDFRNKIVYEILIFLLFLFAFFQRSSNIGRVCYHASVKLHFIYGLRSLGHRDCGFESSTRHGCRFVFFCATLPYVG